MYYGKSTGNNPLHESVRPITDIETNRYRTIESFPDGYTFAPGLKSLIEMANWLLVGAAVFLFFAAKCVKEISDVRKMSVMAPQEKSEVIRRRNFYDNHA